MKIADLQRIVGDEPLFESGLLLVGEQDAADLFRQLSRWVKGGQIVQLRRGLYALAPPLRRREPHPFLIANALERGSYVSLQSALAFHGLIPEAVPTTTSVGPVRPGSFENPFGRFVFHHLRADLCQGYRRLEVAPGQWCRVAEPEKALVDLLYLVPGSDDRHALAELRLSDLAELDFTRLRAFAAATARPKVERAVDRLEELAAEEGAWVVV